MIQRSSGVNVGLGAQLEAEVLDQVGSRAGRGRSYAAQVDNNGLDAVSFAFDLGDKTFHLIAIEGIGDIAADVDERHFGGVCGFLLAQLIDNGRVGTGDEWTSEVIEANESVGGRARLTEWGA